MAKLTGIVLIILLIIPFYVSAEESIGKIITICGPIKKRNINCNSGTCSYDLKKIFPGERIETGKNSRVEILLQDGTAVIVYENSDLLINKVRKHERDKATSISFDSGKLKIIQKNSYLDTSLIITTQVAIIKSVNSELSIVTAENETALFVYSGEAGLASSNSSVVEAYLLKEGEESFIVREASPTKPDRISRILMGSWINRYFVSADKKNVLKYNKRSSLADWPFINNE